MRWRSKKQFVAFRPEVFVQSNFRLLLAPDADVTRNEEGYDFAPWAGVVQAFVPQLADAYHCPICREAPLAPRVARCGHVCCLHCWCQLFSFATKQYRCPLCYEAIQVKGLKPAVLLPLRVAPTPGSAVSLTLMRRSVNSTLSVPLALAVAMTDTDQDLVVPVVDRADELPPLCFARCMIPTRAAALAIAERELAQLAVAEAELVAIDDTDTLRFVALARDLVADTQRALEATAWPHEASAWTRWDGQSTLAKPTAPSASMRVTTDSAVPTNDDAAFSDDDDDDNVDDDDDDDDLGSRLPPGLFADAPHKDAATAANKHMYFYQASDQQPLFLHPICMQALLAEHGAPTALPLTLRAPLVECEVRCMDDRQRRRERALAHLPPATNFAMLEVELRGLVSPARLSLIQPTLDDRAARRRNERARLARDERQAAHRAEAAAATRAARIESAIAGRAMPPPQKKPDFADFAPLAAVAAPAVIIHSSSSNSGGGGQEAWRRLNARRAPVAAAVAPAPAVEEFDEEAVYAPPKATALSLDAFIVQKKGRRR